MNEVNELADVKANFAIVMYGILGDFQRLKAFVENETDLKIRYQRISLAKLFIDVEDGK